MTYQTVFVLMALVWSLSLVYPWDVRWPFARVAVHAPWLLIVLQVLYEQRMPVGMNIRVDLLLIIPALALAFAIYAWRLFMFSRTSSARQIAGRMHKQGASRPDGCNEPCIEPPSGSQR